MAKSIMIQGTMSGVGKSLIVAGLCRIFHQDGYRTAPFKSQNMALNSYVTDEGLEMGRAQVMQAEAACTPASVRMNPVLLKPTTDMGSQLIVNGRVAGFYKAVDYFRYKKQLKGEIMRAYRSLEEDYDIIVLEGAGSCAEINLKADDIVNMGMARMSGSPVLLAADIDRGGVFAQLYGTVELLEKDERAMVKGLLINKFRGDRKLLDPGISMIEKLTGISVAGLIPYMDIRLEDEDSLSPRFDPAFRGSALKGKQAGSKNGRDLADIAVIKLPRISNFTDFNPFEQIEGLSLRYVDRPDELEGADIIFIPGSKNSMQDLCWLRERGLEEAILKAHSSGTVIFGICGGYQILGESLSDPEGAEMGGFMKGMGLLPVKTELLHDKTLRKVEGRFLPSGPEYGSAAFLAELEDCPFEGYEIHMGRTERTGGVSLTENLRTGEEDGCAAGNVFGTYMHGIFDKGEVRRRLIRAICRMKGTDYDTGPLADYKSFKESQYDALADCLRKSLDMDMIYGILNKS